VTVSKSLIQGLSNRFATPRLDPVASDCSELGGLDGVGGLLLQLQRNRNGGQCYHGHRHGEHHRVRVRLVRLHYSASSIVVIRRTLTIGSVAFTLQGIGSAVSAGNAAAAGPTAGVVPAAADEVSALTAAQAQMYQDFSAHAAAIHERFVTTLATSARSYLATEAGQRRRGRLSGTDIVLRLIV
jgi:PE family